MSIKEQAKQLKQDIMKLGLKYNEVSVKSGYCGYSNYIDIKIKTDISEKLKEQIKMLCAKKESIDRDEYTGEVLMGGNTYILIQDMNGYSL